MVTRPARTRREPAPSEEVETTERHPPPGAAHVLALQRAAGNAAVTQLVQGRTLQRFKKGDFASMAMYGLDVDTMAEFERRVGEVVHQRRLVQISEALHAMPWTADVLHAMGVVRRQSNELAFRARFPPRRRPSKQQERPRAMVGFEFQQLDSEVEVEVDPSGEVEEDDFFDYSAQVTAAAPSDKPAPITLQAAHFGAENLWTVVKDGRNLEFVTVPFRRLEDLSAALTEIVAVATRLTTAEPGSRFQLGTTTITVYQPGVSAQPQVNPDIPLDALPQLMIDVAQASTLHDDLFSANTKFWRHKTTNDELAMTAEAAARIQGLTFAKLAHGVGVDEEHLTPAAAGSVRGMLQLLVNACIHKEHFSTKMVKDQPVLSKAHLGHSWQQLAAEGSVGAEAPGLADLLASLYPASEDDDEGDHEEIVGVVAINVPNGYDPVWSSVNALVDIEDERKQALVEFRRAPVIAIDQWLDYAIRCYGHFIVDRARRFN